MQPASRRQVPGSMKVSLIKSPPLNIPMNNRHLEANGNIVSCSAPLSHEFNLSLEKLHSEADSNTLLDNVIHIRSLYKSLGALIHPVLSTRLIAGWGKM